MSYESRAFDERHADGSNTPVVVLVVKGTHDVSRLVGLFTGTPVTGEQVQVGKRIRNQVKSHNFGKAALELLAAHGGPDFTPSREELADQPATSQPGGHTASQPASEVASAIDP